MNDRIDNAVKRIKYIVTGEGKRVPTPRGLSGFRQPRGLVFSYQNVIGEQRDDGTWVILSGSRERTTARHIAALKLALDELGIPYEVAS